MGKLTGENIEQYQTSNGGSRGYFSLKDDGNTARVRFLYDSPDEIEGFVVHKVQVGDKERYVNCLEEDCPFCAAGIDKQVKMFIPLYNEDAQQIQIWERGKTYYSKLSGWCSRYPNIVAQVFDIERKGKKGDQKTIYQEFPVGTPDDTTVQDILDDCEMEELASPLGTIILDKSYADMEEYVKTGSFPMDTTDIPQRRNSREREDRRSETSAREPERRSRRRSGSGDKF